jgi:hypothetical protein
MIERGVNPEALAVCGRNSRARLLKEFLICVFRAASYQGTQTRGSATYSRSKKTLNEWNKSSSEI